MRVSFYLNKNKKSREDRLIYARVSLLKNSFLISTSERCRLEYWDKKTQRANPKKCSDLNKKNNLKNLNIFLERFESKLFDIVSGVRANDPTASFDDIKDAVLRNFNNQSNSFFDVLDRFIKHKEQTSTKSNSEKFRNLKRHLLGFQKESKIVLKFDSFKPLVLEQFQSYLNKNNLFNMAAQKNIAFLKTFLIFCNDNGFTKFDGYKQFKSKHEEIEVVFLNQDEIDLLTNATDLPPRLIKTRDLFIFQLYTGQRYSDIKQVTQNDIINGIWHLRSQKTKTINQIPLSQECLAILSKYNYELPIISNQKQNDNLKELCKLVEIDTPITLVRYKGQERIEIVKKKYELIGTHTARRSFVSLMLIKGMPIPLIQSITGHKNLKSFSKYIGISLNEKINAVQKYLGTNLREVET